MLDSASEGEILIGATSGKLKRRRPLNGQRIGNAGGKIRAAQVLLPTALLHSQQTQAAHFQPNQHQPQHPMPFGVNAAIAGNNFNLPLPFSQLTASLPQMDLLPPLPIPPELAYLLSLPLAQSPPNPNLLMAAYLLQQTQMGTTPAAGAAIQQQHLEQQQSKVQ